MLQQFLKLPSPYYAIIGLVVFLAAYLLKKKSFSGLELSTLIFVIIDSIGVIAGINVAKVSLTATECGDTPIDQIYLFIGGFAVIYVSCKDLWGKYKEIE
ncbi:MAG: hypothetical protein ACRYG7_13130 [Janthinobacterium lividum]